MSARSGTVEHELHNRCRVLTALVNFKLLRFKTVINFYARSQNCERRLSATSCLLVCPSVRMEQLGSHWADFHEIRYQSIFRKYVEKVQVSLKSDKNNAYFTWRPIHISDRISLSFLEWETFQTNFAEKISTLISYSIICVSRAVYEIMWKTIVEPDRPQTTCHKTHAHCMLDTQGYKHTLRIYNTYCFSTATVVTRMCLNVPLYVHCLSRYILRVKEYRSLYKTDFF